MSRHYFDWTPEREAELRALREAGTPHKDIALRLGCSQPAERARCAKLGISAPKKSAAQTLDVFAERLSQTGDITLSAMAAGCSSQHGKNLFTQMRKDLGWQAR